ncbi:MAG: hypothetical protein JO314_12050 [Acidobacteria bacterium]|nr:hypothetical protein [Acidobacteriota bacterium]
MGEILASTVCKYQIATIFTGCVRILVVGISLTLFSLVGYGQRTTPVKTGQWGTTGLNIAVAGTGATLEFDCATGEITSRLRAKRNGSFEAVGTFTRSGPGPVRMDQESQATQVRYKGKVSGKKMTLTITRVDTGESLGSYTLTLGQTGRIRRCL